MCIVKNLIRFDVWGAMKVKNRKKICIVSDCTRRSVLGNELSFHSFPRRGASFVEITTRVGIKERVDRHDEWLKRLKISQHRSDMFVCSQHFAPTDYYFPDMPVKTRVLKSTAVPSRNLPESSICCDASRGAKRLRRGRRKFLKIDESVAGSDEPTFPDVGRLYALHESCVRRSTENLDPLRLETRSGLDGAWVASITTSNEALSSACGIPDCSSLDEIVASINAHSGLADTSSKLRVILTAAKLRGDPSFAALSELFGCGGVRACRALFLDSLERMADALRPRVQKSVDESSRREDRHTSFPFCNQKDTILTLRRIRLRLRRPNCPRCKLQTQCANVRGHVAKFLICVTSTGALIYASDVYARVVPDALILERSDLLRRLRCSASRPAIVLDFRSPEVEAICEKRGILVYPCQKSDQKTNSRGGIVHDRRIADARASADLTMGRIRRFEILRREIPWKFVHCLQSIVVVCCALADFSVSRDSKYECALVE